MRETRRELEGGWTVVYETGTDRDDNPTVIRLHIEPTEPDAPPAGGITGTLLRKIPMGRVLAQTYQELSNTYADLTAAATGSTYADLRYKHQLPPQRGRKHDEKFLLLVARIWDQLVHTSTEPSLYKALVTELARHGHEYQRDGARELVRKARRAGLLEDPPSRGRTGGGLTAKARQLLQD